MFMSVINQVHSVTLYPELAGARVLISGLSTRHGVDIARAFAENACRLVIQSTSEGPEIDGIGEVLAKSATDLRFFHEPIAKGEAAVKFAQTSAQAFGGLDAVVNLIEITSEDLAGRTSVNDIEDLISEKLLPPTLMTRVVANRMRLTLTEGMILNVVLMPEPRNDGEAALAALTRAALATLTRGEAGQWADQAVRINAIGPRTQNSADTAGASLTSEPDIAALATHLASKRGKTLAGHVFDAAGMAKRGC